MVNPLLLLDVYLPAASLGAGQLPRNVVPSLESSTVFRIMVELEMRRLNSRMRSSETDTMT